MQGEGFIKALNMPPAQQVINIKLEANIDDASLKLIGPLLPLISDNRLTELHKTFALEIGGSITQPKVVINSKIHPSPTNGHRNNGGDPAKSIVRKPKGKFKNKGVTADTDDEGPAPTTAPPG